MKIDRITVVAALTVPHPTTPFANARPSVEVSATLEPDEDPRLAFLQLRDWANDRVVEMLRKLQDDAERVRSSA